MIFVEFRFICIQIIVVLNKMIDAETIVITNKFIYEIRRVEYI